MKTNTVIENRTKGEWEVGYGDASNALGIFTKKMLDEGFEEHPICLISPIEKMNETDKANAAFICTACNSHEALVDALKSVNNYFIDLQNKCALAASDERAWKQVSKVLNYINELK